ncbi:MAG: glycosyltransferase family 1 protein [Candidatus Dojkabacteria bacterium]|nr:glycosyltransferase family 1 protein [Candidatus Dojkabacteria bacterium]
MGKEIIRRLLRMILNEGGWEIHLIGFDDLEKNLYELKYSKLSINEISEKLIFHSLGKAYPSNIKNIFRWDKTYDKIIDAISPEIYYAVHFERGLPSVPRFRKNLVTVPKTVVVAHDVIPLVFDKYSEKGFIQNYIKKKFYNFMFEGVQKADLVLTASNFSKNDLITYGKVPNNRIRTIYLGVDEIFEKDKYDEELSMINATLERYNLRHRTYLLYDSGLEVNKGIDGLLSIFKNISDSSKKELPEFLVVTGSSLTPGVGKEITGRNNLGKSFIRKAKKLGVLDNIVAAGFISDEELVTALMKADGYIYLSDYEGFGFGPIQAMKAGIPSIVANRSCLPEITDGGAFLVDTTKIEKTSKAIIKFLTDEDAKNEVIKKGEIVSKKYDWDITTKKTWNEIKELCNDNLDNE